MNVIGHPIARFPDSGSAQLWLSVDSPLAVVDSPNDLEAAPAKDVTTPLHLLYIDQQGAHDAQSLTLPGTFAGASTLQRADGTWVPIVLTTPANSCGTSQLRAFNLDASGALQSFSTVDLPEDHWSILAVDGPRIVLRQGQVYALVDLTGNTLSVHSLRSVDRATQGQQLLGTTLFSAGSETNRIEF